MIPLVEAAPGIFRITQTMGWQQIRSSVNVYVIPGRNGLVFDSGYGNSRSLARLGRGIADISAQMTARGKDGTVTRALASHGHWDHFSGLWFLQQGLGLEILATARQAGKIESKAGYRHYFWEEREMLNRPAPSFLRPAYGLRNRLVNSLLMRLCRIGFVPGPVTVVDENAILTINGETWEIIPVPGHCDDDIVLFNRDRGILLAGDLVLRRITTWLGPPKSDLGDYMTSLERLSRLPGLRLILPAHGSPVTDPYDRLRNAITHRRRRTDQVRRLIADSGIRGLSFGALYDRLYPGKRLQRPLLGGWITVTLKYLLDKGEIIHLPDGRGVSFKSR